MADLPATKPLTEPQVLTLRERQVLALIAQGLASAAVALHLGTSVHTVAKHRSNMLRKLGLPNLAALASYAVKHGDVGGPLAQAARGNGGSCPLASARCFGSSSRATPARRLHACWV
jgi:DNA-binding CsgD family transcriptional regulator